MYMYSLHTHSHVHVHMELVFVSGREVRMVAGAVCCVKYVLLYN